jgi:hypothetical protein
MVLEPSKRLKRLHFLLDMDNVPAHAGRIKRRVSLIGDHAGYGILLKAAILKVASNTLQHERRT